MGLPGGLIIYQGHLFPLKGHLCPCGVPTFDSQPYLRMALRTLLLVPVLCASGASCDAGRIFFRGVRFLPGGFMKEVAVGQNPQNPL